MKIYLTVYERYEECTEITGAFIASESSPKDGEIINTNTTVHEIDLELSDHFLINEFCNRFDLSASKDSIGCVLISDEFIFRDAQKEPITSGRNILIHHGITGGVNGDINNGEWKKWH